MSAEKQPTSEPAETKEKNNLDLFKNSRLVVFAQTTAYTGIFLGIIAIGTYYLDQYLGTFPAIFIGGLIVGYPLTQFLIYKKIKQYSKDKLENGESTRN